MIVEGAEAGKRGFPAEGPPVRKLKWRYLFARDRNDTGEEMPVKDDGHPLPYQDHQRCNNGTPPLTKEDAATVHWSGSPLQCFLLPSLFLSLSLSLVLSLFLSPPPSSKVSTMRNAAFIIIGSILFAIVDLICAHWISTGLEEYIECVAVNAIDQECRLLPLIGFEKRGPAAISRLSFQLSFYLIVLISLTLPTPCTIPGSLLWKQVRINGKMFRRGQLTDNPVALSIYS